MTHGTNGGWLRHKSQGETPCTSCEQAHDEVTSRLNRFRAPADSQITVAALAVILDVAKGTVRSWASRDGWQRAGSRPVRYSIYDALASYRRLAA